MEEKRETKVVVFSTRKLILVGLLLLMLVAAGVCGGQVLFKTLQPQPAQAQTRKASALPGNVWTFSEGYTGTGYQTYLSVFNPANFSGQDADVYVELYGTNGYLGQIKKPCKKDRRITFDINAEAAKLGYSGDISLEVIATQAGSTTIFIPIVCERPMYFNFNGITGGTTSTGYND
jgi:hypothetical protein